MSRHIMINTMFRVVILTAVVSALTALSTACTPSVDPNEGYKNFQTAVARAPQAGYTVYWLGREFQAGGLTFKGPEVSGTEAEGLEGGGVATSYGADLPQGGGVNLGITLYSANAWGRVSARIEKTGVAGWKTNQVVILGRVAELQWASAGTRPVNSLTLILSLGDTHIVAGAGAGGPVTPGGPDANPLVDEQTFLSVMRQLRPYPQ